MSARLSTLFPALALMAAGAAFAQAPQIPAPSPQQPSAAARIAKRSFPSVFQAWNPADNLKSENPLDTMARHDLVFHAPEFFGLRWDAAQEGLATGFTVASVRQARALRQTAQRKNPRLVLLAEIRYRDASRKFLPDDSPWWKRDAAKERIVGWAEGDYYLLDFANSDYQKQVAAQCRAALQTGVFDGVMLDWWTDDDAHLALIQQIRAAIGLNALILANANDREIPKTARYVNGLFMECYRSATPEDWTRIAATLHWAEQNLRAPKINCLETWYANSRQDLNRMRATTCLSLTLSDGYCLFSDPNDLPTPDHLHDWYPFWNRSLSRPVGKGKIEQNGVIRREFQNGMAVYNPMGNSAQTLTFPEARRSLATGKTSRTHTVPALDGDIFLRSKP